jgi:hypothetical protein
VLERQTSLSKHFLAHYGKGAALLEKHLDGWQETSKAREELPPCVEFLLGQQNGVSYHISFEFSQFNSFFFPNNSSRLTAKIFTPCLGRPF